MSPFVRGQCWVNARAASRGAPVIRLRKCIFKVWMQLLDDLCTIAVLKQLTGGFGIYLFEMYMYNLMPRAPTFVNYAQLWDRCTIIYKQLTVPGDVTKQSTIILRRNFREALGSDLCIEYTYAIENLSRINAHHEISFSNTKRIKHKPRYLIQPRRALILHGRAPCMNSTDSAYSTGINHSTMTKRMAVFGIATFRDKEARTVTARWDIFTTIVPRTNDSHSRYTQLPPENTNRKAKLSRATRIHMNKSTPKKT